MPPLPGARAAIALHCCTLLLGCTIPRQADHVKAYDQLNPLSCTPVRPAEECSQPSMGPWCGVILLGPWVLRRWYSSCERQQDQEKSCIIACMQSPHCQLHCGMAAATANDRVELNCIAIHILKIAKTDARPAAPDYQTQGGEPWAWWGCVCVEVHI